jgi:hypothetical protein
LDQTSGETEGILHTEKKIEDFKKQMAAADALG